MKKLLFQLTAVAITALATTSKLNAQSAITTAMLDPQKQTIEDFKNSSPSASNKNLMGISPKAVKDFSKNYKKITTENWSIIADGFTAKFILDGVTSSVYYDTKGRWSGVLKSYPEAKLPAEIRQIVKRSYYDYSIIYVAEIETVLSEGTPTYVVYVEDDKSIKWLRIFDNEMEEYKVVLK